MSRPVLSTELTPQLMSRTLSSDGRDQLKLAMVELQRCAEANDGYATYQEPNDQFPSSRRFAEFEARFSNGTGDFSFNRLNLSIGRQPDELRYRLTGLHDNSVAGQLRQGTWSFLYNLHEAASYRLAFVNVPVEDLPLHRANEGLLELGTNLQLESNEEQLITIPPREGRKIWAVRICVSHILHTVVETGEGFFIGDWRHDEPAITEEAA